MTWKYSGITYNGTEVTLDKPVQVSTDTSNASDGALIYSTSSGYMEKFNGTWRTLYQDAQSYIIPSWPDEEVDEVYRASLDSTDTPFNNAVGTAHGTISGTLNYGPSFYLGKVGANVVSGSWRVLTEPDLRRNTSWTVDVVCGGPEINSAEVVFLLANSGSGNIKGGLQFSGAGNIQTWIPSAWTNIGVLTNKYYGIHVARLMAWTVQWGDDNILRVWCNGFQFYESGVLTPPTVVGDEGIIATNAPWTMFFRYRASAPATPHSWHSKALYGGA